MKRRWFGFTWATGAVIGTAVVVLAIVAQGVSHGAADKTFTIRGSTTVLPIAQAAAEVFMDRRHDVHISVQGGGSGVGIASLIDGTCDIADSSRQAKEEEIAAGRVKGVEFHPCVIAMDGIVMIIHPSNPVSRISRAQIKGMYTGEISNWAALGGKDQAIVVVSRDVASGTFEAFMELVLDKKKVRPDALMQASNQAVVAAVANSPGSIGYVGLGYLSSKVKAVMVDGVPASKETIVGKVYPLSRPLFMYTNGYPKGAVKEFLDFVRDAEGQKLVEQLGFVGIR